jgi:hypothetical protein
LDATAKLRAAATPGEPVRDFTDADIEHAAETAFDGWNPATIERAIAAARDRAPDPLEVPF